MKFVHEKWFLIMCFMGDSQPYYNKMNVCDNIIDTSFQKTMFNI